MHNWCLKTLAPPKVVLEVILAILGGLTQYVAPFIADDSDTTRHLDHITVQVAKDRARCTSDASQDSLQDVWTLGLTRGPTCCQQAIMALVGTLVQHRSASLRAEATRMFWEIASAHGMFPEVHYPVTEFATLAGRDWVNCIPRALATLGVGLYNPIQCHRAARVQLQSPPGNVVTLRTAKRRHRHMCRLKVPHTTPWHGHHGPTIRFRTTTTHGQQRCRSASTSAPMSTSTTAVANRGPPTSPDGATPWSTCSTPLARGTPASGSSTPPGLNRTPTPDRG